ncbi:hypothetical protein BKA66DRAFT_473545 [Pyrenochaeta sp. MPI-SDFR-AT-0127]|nr:hypothetical protein BKA66DRAFT_473545 [Pyrenochaeta sp. MPI-SDFR-AT-0127]
MLNYLPHSMPSNDLPFADVSDSEIIQTGKRFGYGSWLQPIITANDQTGSKAAAETQNMPAHVSARRGRGRPRVTKLRDGSAAEKRRAQVREAQRTYQKRKDTATETEKRRVDELLQLLFDISTDVEALLQVFSATGTLRREDDISMHIQRLWTTYDAVINNPCVRPELRLLQIKNGRRIANHVSNKTSTDTAFPSHSGHEHLEVQVPPPTRELPVPFDPSGVSFELVRLGETTVMQTFQRTTPVKGQSVGRRIFDVVKERQAALKEADRSSSG